MGASCVFIAYAKNYVWNARDIRFALIIFVKVVARSAAEQRYAFTVIINTIVWNVTINTYASTNDFSINALNVKGDGCVRMV